MAVSLLQQFDPSIYVSLAFLFGISAQFTAMDGYTFLRRTVATLEGKVGVLYAVAAVTCLFSPFILNDVVIIVLTPVVVRYADYHGIDPAPLLVTEITMANIASSLSPFGNPQNILLWESSGVGFGEFVLGTSIPLLISGVLVSLTLLPFAMRTGGAREFPTSVGSAIPAVYLGLVTATIIVADFAGVRPYISLGASFLIGFLFTFRSVRQVFEEFDFKSLATLYVFIGSITVVSILTMPIISQYVSPAAEGTQPYSALFVGITSNIISNVPTTQLILNTAHVSSQIAPKIAVEAGLAGNLGPVASFANILALQIARRAGLPIKRTIALQFVIGLVSFLPALF